MYKGVYAGTGCVGGVYSSLLYGVHQLRGAITILGLKNLVSTEQVAKPNHYPFSPACRFCCTFMWPLLPRRFRPVMSHEREPA